MKLTQKYLDNNNIKYTISEKGFITVGGSLNLEGTQITTLPDNLTVGGSLNLEGTQITTLPDNLTVGRYLNLEGTQITTLPDNLTVGGYLNLEGTQITTLPDNLTVGGYLNLEGTQITTLPDNLTVGGYLDLRETQITTLPDNLTVGGSLYLRGTQIDQPKKRNLLPEGFFLMVKMSIELKFNAKGYTIADGILGKIINSKPNVKKIIPAGKKTALYVVGNGKGLFAHGDSIKEATQELAFKAGDRDASEFKGLPLDTLKDPIEWAFVYRMVTGACKYGTNEFMNRHDLTKKYTLSELIEITKDQWGHKTFKEFFTNENNRTIQRQSASR